MKIDLLKLVIKRVREIDVDEMILHRIQYITELYGEHEAEQVVKLQSELKKHIVDSLKNDSFIAFVAELENKPLSYGAIALHTVPGDFNSSTYLEGDVLNMYTIPEARKQGISTIILEKLIAEARNRGVSKLALHTTQAGEKLYRSAGFVNPTFPYMELVLC